MRLTGKGKDGGIYLHCGDDEEVALSGYKRNQPKSIVTWICIVATIGFLRLIFHWKPDWMVKCTHSPCSLKDADSVVLQDQYKQVMVSKVVIHRSADQNDHEIHSKTDTPSSLYLPNDRGEFQAVLSVRFFKYKKYLYIWHDDANGQGMFKELASLGDMLTCSYLHEQKGLSESEQFLRRKLFSTNEIKVRVNSILKLLFLEVLNPFYIFQVFSVSLWYADEYEQYATVIVLMSVVSISVSIYQLRKNQTALRDTIQQAGIITVWRQNDLYVTIPAEDVVPGDVIILPPCGCPMLCDAVLINGNCIVNEASLTGESVPVTKTPLPNYADTLFDPVTHARHVLYCGTQVIQTRYYGEEKVKAVVIKTGYMTQKGRLVRSIMFPKPVDFKFSQDAAKFISFLGFIALVGFIYTVITMKQRGESAGTIIKRALDLITIVVPPALPAAMTVGIIYAQNRLKKSNIFCISPRSINISGSINCVCFDKTGTLTEEGLDVLGVIPSHQAVFGSLTTSIEKLPICELLKCLASCHSLTIINNDISGDPLDMKMFEATNWEIEEPEVDDSNKFEIIMPTVVRPLSRKKIADGSLEDSQSDIEIGIIRQFTFSSSLQRMSVITRSLTGKHFELYAKGAPEMIASLCIPTSVPSDFNEVLKKYTMKGYRVIGLGHRKLQKLKYSKIQRIQRTEVECELTFLGLMVMENRLKAATTKTITSLHDANIRTVMITGDNILTAMSVARECGLIKSNEVCMEVTASHDANDGRPVIKFSDHSTSSSDDVNLTKESLCLTLDQRGVGSRMRLALTGKSLDIVQQFYPKMINKLMLQAVIFARMSPEQKQFAIEKLQKLGLYVGMCGDGANDCGALKAAHAGISLSEAEASIASPFTSKTDDISCVPTLIREGRTALVTSFGMFKYMAIYSLCQFTSVLFLYTLKSNLTDWQFIYVDLFLITSFAALFGRTEAHEKLSKRPPSLSLISATPILSLLVHVILIGTFQGIAFYITTVQPWYKPHVPDPNSEDDNFGSYDNFAIFSVSLFQYIGTAVIFSKGAPYRKSIFTNKLFLLAIVVLTGMSIYLVIYPAEAIVNLFEVKIVPLLSFRAMLLLLAAANFMTSFLAEFFIIDFVLSKRFRIDEKQWFTKSKFKYEDLTYQECSGTISPNESSSPPTLLSPLSLDSPMDQSLVLKPPLPMENTCQEEPEIVISSPQQHTTLPISFDQNSASVSGKPSQDSVHAIHLPNKADDSFNNIVEISAL